MIRQKYRFIGIEPCKKGTFIFFLFISCITPFLVLSQRCIYPKFYLKWIHLLPSAYDEALKEISNRQGVSFSEMKESHPLLLLYAVPRSFGARINSGNNRLDDKSAQFQVRTTTIKEDWEEMAILSGVRINEGNGIVSSSLKWNDVDENNNDFLKQQKIVFVDSAPSGTVDKALVVVDAKMDQSDLTGIRKGLFREDKLAVRETYFVLGLYKW